MRVLFDGYWWASGPISNRTVMRELIAAWRREYPADELHLVVPGAPPEDGERWPGMTFHSTRMPLQALINGLVLPAVARRVGAELIVAHNFSPLGGPSAVFIHDLMFIDHPEWFTRAENAYFRAMVWTARRAGHLFTSSAAEAARIRRITRRPQVTPIGLGLGAALLEAVPQRPTTLPETAGDFLLAVGRLNVRKNLAATVAALLAAGELSSAAPLLVVGESSGRALEHDETIRAGVADGRVLFLGGVPDAELRWLYEHCAAFVFMSLDEGFGLPCLEALVFGAPAAVSDIPPFRDILGGRADYADPHDPESIVAAVRRARGRRRGPVTEGSGDAATDAADADADFDRDPGREPLERYSWAASVRALRGAMRGATPETTAETTAGAPATGRAEGAA